MDTRRKFIKKAGAGLLTAGIPSVLLGKKINSPNNEEYPIKTGMAGYSFLHFDIEKTLEILQILNVKYLCIKDFHLPLDATQEECDAFQAKLRSKDVTGYAVGPIAMRSEAEIDRAFVHAKMVGVNLVVGVPNYELLPYVDRKVKEYGFNYAIHIHGPDARLYPNAKDVIDNVQHLDPRIGICLDIGHNIRCGDCPVEDLEKYASRVFDVHIKDVTAAAREGRDIELGRGVIDFSAFVKMLRKVNYNGVCSLEYEKDMREPFLGIAESMGYFNGVIDATK